MIPTEILNKPGRLTAEEYAMIKTHTVKGARILRDLSNTIGGENEPLLQVAYAICRWHHERWDGGGYPDKLKGDAIHGPAHDPERRVRGLQPAAAGMPE